MIVVGKLENDDVAAANRTVRKKFFIPRAPPFKDKFVHEKVIANQQRGFHGLRRYLKGLNDKRGAEEGEKNGDKQRFRIFEHGAVRGFAMPGFRNRLLCYFKRGCFCGHLSVLARRGT